MTIKLPDYEKAFDYENNFYLSCGPRRIGKFVAHYELYKMAANVAGNIVECGVFKGASFLRWANFRELFQNNATQKIIGFDIFGQFPDATLEEEVKHREMYLDAAGDQSISADQLREVLDRHNLNRNIELVEGDILKSIPDYLKRNPSLRISMLIVDVDMYEPTKTILEQLYPLVVRGGVVVLDDYIVWEGATKAIDEYFKGAVSFKKFPFAPTPTYFVKE